jgi:TRAP-type C4-dicarboxylate transport system substrate-binding protein
MIRRIAPRFFALLVAAGLLCIAPGDVSMVAASTGKTVLKVALMVPRTQQLAVEEKKYNKDLAELTDGQVQVRVYWGGAAGDDKDVLRKMRAGQIDGTALGLDVMSQVVREAMVLATPGLYTNYDQVDAVRKELTPDFDAEAYRNGFKVMGWGDVGRLRIFSKQKITKVADFKRIRPWLYPESQMLKEFYKQIGATGIPLGIAEVYGGMQTGMIDTFWGTAVLAAALQWHRTAEYVSREGLGFISGAFIFRRDAWDPLPAVAKKAMLDMVAKRSEEAQRDIRKADDKAMSLILKRGYTALEAKDPGEWWSAGKQLRRRLIGRLYTEDVVDRAERIAMKYASKDQLAYYAK